MPAKVDVTKTLASMKALQEDIEVAGRVATFNFVEKVRQAALDNINRLGLVGTTNDLRRSLQNSSRSIREIPFVIGHRLTVSAPHGAPIEFGRRPAGIPKEVILNNVTGLTAWVRKKIRPKLRESKKNRAEGRRARSEGRRRELSGMPKRQLNKILKKEKGRRKDQRVDLQKRRAAGLVKPRKKAISTKERQLALYQSIAYAIARKKARSPTKARPFIQPAIRQLGGAKGLSLEYEAALKDVLQ